MTTVADVMSVDVQTLTADATVGELRDLLHLLGIGSVPIVDEAGIVGIVTSTDVVEDWSSELAVGTLMRHVVHTVPSTASVESAARTMRDRHVHHLVVTDDGRAVDGVVSSWDLLAALAELVEEWRAGTVPPRPVQAGDLLVMRPVGGADGRRATIAEVHGADGLPPYVVRWDDEPGGEPTEIEVVRRGDTPLDGCER